MNPPKGYSEAEAHVFGRWVEASRLVGNANPVKGLGDCIGGGLREVAALPYELANMFLFHVLAEVDPSGGLAKRLLAVMLPPDSPFELPPQHRKPRYSRLFPKELVDKGAVAALAIRINALPMKSTLVSSQHAEMMIRYHGILRNGVVSPESVSSDVFRAAVAGYVRDGNKMVYMHD